METFSNISIPDLITVSGSWDELETSPIGQPLRESIKARIYSFFSGVVVALFPATIYFLAQQHNLLSSGALQEYLGFGVVLWAVLAILITIDPRFGDKVEAFEKIATDIPGLLKRDRK